MHNDIVLWTSPNGVPMPKRLLRCEEIIDYSVVLKPLETQKIVKAYNAELYDMSVEYAWARTINILREKISSFGDDFISEMLGRVGEKSFGINSVSNTDLINLATDLGFINSTAQLEFLHIDKVLNHYLSQNITDEIEEGDALQYLKTCVKYILGIYDGNISISFTEFRDKLKNEILSHDSKEVENIKISPYFHKRTTLRTLLSLAKMSQDAELEKILANTSILIPAIWSDLVSEDRYQLGFAYSEAVSKGNKMLSSGFKATLLKVKGFDYVPENLRSTTFIMAANSLLDSHYAMNNFYNEPEKARFLASLGTSIPAPALGPCMTATLACKTGNSYGTSNAAQEYLNSILESISPGKWEYYLNSVFVADEKILLKLDSQITFNRWCSIVNEYKLDELLIKDSLVKTIIIASKNSNHDQCERAVSKLMKRLRG